MVVPPLLTAINNADPAIRRSAINSLARIGKVTDYQPIVMALSDENSAVRKAAVSALISLRGEQSLSDIRLLLDDDPGAEVVAHVVLADHRPDIRVVHDDAATALIDADHALGHVPAAMAMEMGGTAGRWVSMFNLSNIPVHVNDLIFGDVSAITSEAPAGEFASWMLVSWFFAWTLIPFGILWARYRRLTP